MMYASRQWHQAPLSQYVDADSCLFCIHVLDLLPWNKTAQWYCLLIVVKFATSFFWNCQAFTVGFRQHRAAVNFSSCLLLPSVLWCWWLGGRKGIRPVKYRVVGCWCGCLELGADRFYLSGTGSLNKGPFNGCVCVFRTFLVSECILDCRSYFKVLFRKVHKLCS